MGTALIFCLPFIGEIILIVARKVSIRGKFFIEKLILRKDKIAAHIIIWVFLIYYSLIGIIGVYTKDNLDFYTILSAVLTLVGLYGLYYGFLPFIAGYDNRKNDNYLGMNKLEFAVKHSLVYQITKIPEFYIALLFSILALYFLENQIVYYIWESVIIFLVFIFVMILWFIFDIFEVIIEMKSDNDYTLKRTIRKKIGNKYSEYFDYMNKKYFSDPRVGHFFEQLEEDIKNLESDSHRCEYVKIVFDSLSRYTNLKIDNLAKFSTSGIVNYKSFVVRKYDLLLNQDLFNKDNDMLFSVALEMFEEDIKIFDKLIERNHSWIKNDKYQYVVGGIEESSRIEDIIVTLYSNFPIEKNIHGYIFKKISNLANSDKKIAKLFEEMPNFGYEKIKSEKEFEYSGRLDISIPEMGNVIQIKEESWKNIKSVEIFSASKNAPKIKSGKEVYLYLNQNIERIVFEDVTGSKSTLVCNEKKKYYNKFVNDSWKNFLNAYVGIKDKLEGSLFDLCKLKTIGNYHEGILNSNDDTNLAYSEICFDYLMSEIGYANKENIENVFLIVKSMAGDYRGAYALYRLFYLEDNDWDCSVRYSLDILRDVFRTTTSEKKNQFNRICQLIVKCDQTIDIKKFKRIFDTRYQRKLDESFFYAFKEFDKLKLLLVQDILLDDMDDFTREIELNEGWKRKNLMLKYLNNLELILSKKSIYDSNNYLITSNSLSNFIVKNISDLKYTDWDNMPLYTILILEDIIRVGIYDNSICLIMDKLISRNHINVNQGMFTKFFTVKMVDKDYYIYLQDTDFVYRYRMALLGYLKYWNLDVDAYISVIEKEVENFDYLRLSKIEKALIEKQLNKIIFQE